MTASGMARRNRAPQEGSPATVPRHPRGAAGTTRRNRKRPNGSRQLSPTIRDTRPSPEALRPLARALVALAIEVRSEGLEVGGEQRSHGSVGKGGGRCAA